MTRDAATYISHLHGILNAFCAIRMTLSILKFEQNVNVWVEPLGPKALIAMISASTTSRGAKYARALEGQSRTEVSSAAPKAAGLKKCQFGNDFVQEDKRCGKDLWTAFR